MIKGPPSIQLKLEKKNPHYFIDFLLTFSEVAMSA